MHNKGPDTPNNKISYSIESPMVRHHEIDTKFAFLAHLVQKLEAKPIFWVLTLWRPYCGGHIGFHGNLQYKKCSYVYH